MKFRYLCVLICVVISLKSYAQHKNEIKHFTGFSNSNFIKESSEFDNLNWTFETFNLGIKYARKLNNNLSIESGVDLTSFYNVYSECRILFEEAEYVFHCDRFRIVTIPVYADYTFGKHIFVNGGMLLNLRSAQGYDEFKSAAVGYGFGFGGKFNVGVFSFYFNPNFKMIRSPNPFLFNAPNGYPIAAINKLGQLGIELGMGVGF